MTIYNAESDRFGEGALAFSMERFTGPSDQVIWRFGVSRYIGNKLIEQDATLADLFQMEAFIGRAKTMLLTDGGRKEAPGGGTK